MMEEFVSLEIEPFFDRYTPRSCDDNIMISVAKWKNQNYALMYSDQWRFDFTTKKIGNIFDKTELASRLYYLGDLNTAGIFFYCTGIEIISMEIACAESFINKLRAGNPVAAKLDTYYLPWHEKLYKKVHSEHSCLFVGYDAAGFYVNDTTMKQTPVSHEYMSFEDFNKCSYGKAAFFSLSNQRPKKKDKSVIQNISEDSFLRMEEFKKYIQENGFTKEDLEPFDGGEGIVLRAIRNIIRCRNNYLLAFDSTHKGEQSWCKEFSQLITMANAKWELQKVLLQKAFFEKDENKYNNSILNLIEEAKEYEIKAYNLFRESEKYECM